ncbi:hypothetical protein [Kitasatospora sp. NPDC058190]|uniref:hypothetical protein n=1 Tax=Kitasatospora sp. NPDC058190 TaxID=3346371 RepID=UPI0036DD6B73
MRGNRHLSADEGLADQALVEGLYDILDREPGADRIIVTAKIDHRNRAGKRLTERNGLQDLRRAPELTCGRTGRAGRCSDVDPALIGG